MSKLRMLREVQLPCIQDAQIGYIDALNRSFETISIGTTAFNDVPSVQWLTRRRQNLQELNIFVSHLVIISMTSHSYPQPGPQQK